MIRCWLTGFRPSQDMLAPGRQRTRTKEVDMRNKLLVVLVLSASLAASVAMSQNESQPPPGDLTLGEVNFPISCSEPAQQQFNRAVAILHSFWYEEAEKAFTSVTDTDATCVMGYWGIAMSNWHPMWFPPTGAELKAGSNAVAKAGA